MDRSPYEEHEDERRPCSDCGGTHTVAGQPCPLCGPPSQPDPAAWIKAHMDAAAHLRKLLRMAGQGYLARLVREDIERHEQSIARLTGHKEVA